MIHTIKKIIFFWKKQPTTDFSLFFSGGSSRGKQKFLKDVVRRSKEDQRALMKKYKVKVTG
jgi:hypothetical protein